MKNLLSTTDPIYLSFLEALLNDAGVETTILDAHMSIMEGSLGILPRRIYVQDEDWDLALKTLREAGIEDGLENP